MGENTYNIFICIHVHQQCTCILAMYILINDFKYFLNLGKLKESENISD